MIDVNVVLAVGSILSGIAAAITASVIYFKMRESNKITRETLEETKRSNKLEILKNQPRLLLDHASYELDDNFMCLHADLINVGKTTASNIRMAFEAKNQFFGEEFMPEVIKNEKILFNEHLGSLANDQVRRISPSVPFGEDTGMVCIAVWFIYDFFDEKDHEEIHYLVFQRGVSPHEQYTIENKRMKELRKQQNKE